MAVKIKLRKDSDDKGDQPIIPPVGGGGGVGVDPVAPPVTSAPPGGGGSAPVTGNPLVPTPAAPGQFTFVPSSYQPFQQATNYGYNNWLDQMRDAFDTPTRGAGIFGDLGGNNMPRYAFGNRPDSMMKGSGFNAGQFLAPYLAKLGGGSPGAPAPMPGGPPAMPPGVGGARGLLGPSQPMMPPPGAAMQPSPNGIRGGLLGNGAAQSPMQAYIAQLLAQQNQSGPGGMRGPR